MFQCVHPSQPLVSSSHSAVINCIQASVLSFILISSSSRGFHQMWLAPTCAQVRYDMSMSALRMTSRLVQAVVVAGTLHGHRHHRRVRPSSLRARLRGAQIVHQRIRTRCQLLPGVTGHVVVAAVDVDIATGQRLAVIACRARSSCGRHHFAQKWRLTMATSTSCCCF